MTRTKKKTYPDDAEPGKKDDTDVAVAELDMNILSSSSSLMESALSKERNERPLG